MERHASPPTAAAPFAAAYLQARVCCRSDLPLPKGPSLCQRSVTQIIRPSAVTPADHEAAFPAGSALCGGMSSSSQLRTFFGILQDPVIRYEAWQGRGRPAALAIRFGCAQWAKRALTESQVIGEERHEERAPSDAACRGYSTKLRAGRECAWHCRALSNAGSFMEDPIMDLKSYLPEQAASAGLL